MPDPVRMCARCQHITDTPVLVHEVHSASGPGWNVYACPSAPHYPPAQDALEILDAALRLHTEKQCVRPRKEE